MFMSMARGMMGRPRVKDVPLQLCQSAPVNPALCFPVPASAKQRWAASAETSVSLPLGHCYAMVSSFLSF